MRAEVSQAVEVLKAGGLVGLPTETVYGLGADASNELAVRRIFAAKGRPSNHPLIVHVASAAIAQTWAARWPAAAQTLSTLWPGPLTLIVPRANHVLDVVTGGQETVGLRVPAHPLALELLTAFGQGIAAPSANRFGHVSPTTAQHVRDELGDAVDLVLDGGPCAVGVESTIVDVTSDRARVLRPGGVSVEQLETRLGARVEVVTEAADIRAPGLLASHYAPRAGLVLVTAEQLATEVARYAQQGLKVAVLAPLALSAPTAWLRLTVSDEAEGFARELYARLREADAAGAELIVTVPPALSGVGLAVADRLRKAAAPRAGH